MKTVLNLFVILLFFGVVPNLYAQDSAQKTFCMSVFENEAPEIQIKEKLLLNAKRAAISELFGEMISSYSEVENFVLTKDSIRSSSSGLVRVKGSPVYHNGKSFGEVCVTIDTYVAEEDRRKFQPQPLANKFCHSDGELTTQELKTFTKEQVIVQALLLYDRNLESAEKELLLTIVHDVKYLESGFIPDSETYCVKFQGVIYPIETLSLVSEEKNRMSVKSSLKQWLSGIWDD